MSVTNPLKSWSLSCRTRNRTIRLIGSATKTGLYKRTTDKAYLGMRPSKKSIRHMIETAHELTAEVRVWQETTTW
jgi:RNA-directed DNA polymerase